MQVTQMNHSFLTEPSAILKERFCRQGYLLVKGLFPTQMIQDVRSLVLSTLVEQKWGVEREGSVVAQEPIHRIGSEGFFKCISSLMAQEKIHQLSYQYKLLEVLRKILGEPVYPHPRKMVRLSYPFSMNPMDLTPAHQDVVYVRGEPDTFTVWIPLGSYKYEEGGLEVARESHLKGFYPTRANEEGRFNCTASEVGLDSFTWCGTDFELGDALIMHSLTLHKAAKNHSNQFRISLDTRFSSTRGHINEEQLLPPYHPHVSDWESFNGHWGKRDLFSPPSTLQIESKEVPLSEILTRPSIVPAYVTY